MSPRTARAVRAARPITRYRTTVIDIGCAGSIVDVRAGERERTYTVSFAPVRLRGASVIVSCLTEFDVEDLE